MASHYTLKRDTLIISTIMVNMRKWKHCFVEIKMENHAITKVIKSQVKYSTLIISTRKNSSYDMHCYLQSCLIIFYISLPCLLSLMMKCIKLCILCRIGAEGAVCPLISFSARRQPSEEAFQPLWVTEYLLWTLA